MIWNIVIALALSLLPALSWLLFYYKKDYREPEPKGVIFKTFVAGMTVAVPFLGLKLLMAKIPNLNAALVGISAVMVFAALEEMAKLTASIFVVTRNKMHFNQVIDGVVYAVTAALGFAFVENLFYFIQFFKYEQQGLWSLFLFRSLGTMLAHTLFSGLAGLIWAYAYFSKQITPFQEKGLLAFRFKDFINTEILSLHIIRKNILSATPSRRGGHEKKILVLEGMVAATLLHAIFNLTTTYQVLGLGLTFLLVPIIMGGLIYVSFVFTKKLNNQILKVV